MTLGTVGDALLNVATIVGFALDIPVALYVLRAAWRRPRYWSLVLMAYLCVGIAVIVPLSAWAAANQAAGYPVDREVVRLAFRAVLLYLAFFPPLFIWVRRTGRFRDGAT